MNWLQIKNSKALKIALIVALPTALVAGYYGYKFVRRKIDERLAKESEIDTTGMELYSIMHPFCHDDKTGCMNALDYISQQEYNKYSYVSEKVDKINGVDYAVYTVKIKPENEAELLELIKNVQPNVVITKVRKDTANVILGKNVCEKGYGDVDSIKSVDDFNKSVGCLPNTWVLGYELKLLKDIPNLSSKVSIDELKEIYKLAQDGAANWSGDDGDKFLAIIHKIRPV